MLPPDLSHVLARQSGVVSRPQALAGGLNDADLRRLVRRRDLTRVHPGVFVEHTGELTWLQRAWAAVLSTWPAALCDASALHAYGLGTAQDGRAIDVLVHAGRHPVAPPGVTVHRTRRPDEILWNASPPRVRLEVAVVWMADRAVHEHAAVRLLTDAVGSRRTTAPRLRDTMERTPRLARRALLQRVLTDVSAGTHSVLEHAYLHRVERAHALPLGTRQARSHEAGRTAYRDVLVGAYGVVLELDGRLHHGTTGAREQDLDRDLRAAASGLQTVRLTWGQVVGDPCRTAHRLGELFRLRGWTGSPVHCGDCP